VSLGTWLDDAGDTTDVKLSSEAPWALASTGGHDGPAVFATGDYGNLTCAALTTPTVSLGSDPQLSFWSRYDIESSWDKGVVEISADDGTTWEVVPVAYPSYADHTSDACDLPVGDFFSGAGATYQEYTASLSQWAGLEVIIRWRISSDTSQRGDGWWIDEVSVAPAGVAGICSAGPHAIFTDGFEGGSVSSWSASAP
jgi:hypothetical protein